jgi:hypothetical protein
MRARELDGLTIIQGSGDGLRGRRLKPLLADSNDDLLFVTNLSGSSLCSQVGRELGFECGEATFLSCAEVGFQEFPNPAHFLNLRIPRRSLAQLVASPEDCLVRRVPPDSEALRLGHPSQQVNRIRPEACDDLTRGGGILGMVLGQYAGRHDRHASDSAQMAVRWLEAR